MEVYQRRLDTTGKRKADFKLLIDVLMLFRPAIIRPMRPNRNMTNYAMLGNYFKIGWRNLFRHKEYAGINITGFAVSIAACLVLFHTIQYELSFDAFHTNKERIYRITNEAQFSEGIDYGQGVPAPLPEAVRLDFPQLEQVATVLSMPGTQVDVLDKQLNSNFKEELGVFFAEPEFFKIFDFDWLHGSPEALREPNTAVLTQETAEKYFGDWETAIGKSIEYQNTHVLKVTGILKNIPPNSDFPLKVVISFKTRGEESQSWGSITSRRQCYVLLDENTTAEQVQGLMPGFEKKYHPIESDIHDHYTLQPINEIHFDSRYGNFNGRTISKTTLLSLGVIGVLLIITAAINFVNLAIAQAMRRSKEVGVRKVLGSSRWQLSGQFFGETFLILAFASLLAIVLKQVSLTTLRPLLNLSPSYQAPWRHQAILFLSVIVIVTIVSGFYPARVLGAFKPVQALKGKVTNQTIGGASLRKSLVVVQFAIAQILVIVTLVIVHQLDFFRHAPLGFDKDAIVLFSVPTDSLSQTRVESFRQNLLHEAEIQNVTFGFTEPQSKSNRRISFQFDNATEDAPFEVNVKYADVEYFDTYDLSLVAGRLYQASDTAREYVVNETFLEKFGIQNPEEGLGKTITRNDVPLPIVGVLKDFHVLSMHEKIEPLIMMCDRSQYRTAGVKLQSKNISDATQKIADSYRQFFPDNVFEYTFLDESVAKQYENEERLSAITKIFSGLAIFISALGLYGLISFMAVQRTKEVGIRKVLGASMQDIVLLFHREFMLLVLIAFVVSAPLTGYFMSGWLNTFAYRIDLSPWIFILSMALSVVVLIVTISFRSVKAALANPINSLRTE